MDLERSLDDITYKIITNSQFTFYGLFMSEINRCFSRQIDTACIGKHPSAFVPIMMFNPEFWEKLNTKQRMFLTLHEVNHYVDEAWLIPKAMGMEDHELSNIAQDIVINSDLLKSADLEMPEGGMHLGLFPELKLAPDKDSYYYYLKLKEAKDKKEDSKGKKDSLAGKPGNKDGSSGCKALDGMLDRGDMVNIHASWGDLMAGLSDIQKEVLSRQIQELIKRTAEETAKANGNVPARIQELLKKEIIPIKETISWKSLFRRFVTSSISTDVKNTRKRPNRKYPDAPRLKYKNKVRVLIGVDQSGSISEQDLDEFFSETYHIFKAGAKVTIASWDTMVHDVREYNGEKVAIRHCGGGTDSNPVIEYANENRGKFDCFINFTDGYIGGVHTRCLLPMLWLINTTGTTDLQGVANKHSILKMSH